MRIASLRLSKFKAAPPDHELRHLTLVQLTVASFRYREIKGTVLSTIPVISSYELWTLIWANL